MLPLNASVCANRNDYNITNESFEMIMTSQANMRDV